MENPYIVYVNNNDSGYITAVNSSAFLPNTEGWTEIDKGYGDKYHHAQGNYFSEPVYTDSGVCRYKLENGKAVKCTAEEIAQQEAALPQPDPSTTLETRVEALETKVEELGTIGAEYNTLITELSEVYEDA